MPRAPLNRFLLAEQLRQLIRTWVPWNLGQAISPSFYFNCPYFWNGKKKNHMFKCVCVGNHQRDIREACMEEGALALSIIK